MYGNFRTCAAESPESNTYLPAPLPPLFEVWTLGAQRGRLAVPRMHDGIVGIICENTFGYIVEQLLKFGWRVRLTHAAGKQAIPNKKVSSAVDFGGDHHAPFSVPTYDSHREFMPRKGKRVPIMLFDVHRARQCGGVQRRGDMGGIRGGQDFW